MQARGPFLLLVVLSCLEATSWAQSATDVGSGATTNKKCDNTVGGRWLLTDDQGLVCKRDELDHTTGCCKGGRLHACDSCSTLDKCCSEYEHCVSCCMKPGSASKALMERTYRGMNKPETGLWPTEFEFCRAKCRTTSRSTAHENAFIMDRRYCFSKLGRPRAAPAPPLLPDVTVHVGGDGKSCDETCAAKGGRVCARAALAAVNNCDSLREHFMCEAGCSAGNPDQHEFPAYVVGGAPKQQYPALCATLPPADADEAPEFSCSDGIPGVKRLCTCKPAPPPSALPAAGGQQGAQGVPGSLAAGVMQQQQQQQAAGGAQGGGAQQGGVTTAAAEVQ